MSHPSSGPGEPDTRDGEILADLFDTLLQEILEGNTPDLARYLPDRPDLKDRIARTWALACSVAGRREPSRPVLGGYEIVRELGHGGMGTVYLARHQALQRDVAIKVLPHSLAMSGHAKQRFLEEARALARLRHDHVVRVHRIIDHAEMLAFEMEYVEGPSLQKVILGLQQQPKPQSLEALAAVLGLPAAALGTRSPVEWFVRTGIRIARALAEVHRHGLVHRDVKPSNVLLRKDGQPLLADFGLARLGDPEATQPAGFAGTPIYAAPERLRDGDAGLDARADVYSLAVTLYEALSLRPPFAGSTTHEVLRRIENGQLPALRKQAPHVSRDLETVLGKAMEPDPKHRYPTADAFADDLERLLSLQPILARPAGPVRALGRFLRRNQRVCIGALAGALLVAGATWPALAHAGALASSREASAAATHAARLQLLSLDSLHGASLRAFAGAGSQPLRQPSAAAAQAQSLGTAARHYAEALAADPTNEDARLEHAVVAVAAELRQPRAAPDPTAPADRRRAALPPLARAAAAADREAVRGGLATADAADRFAAGLLAYLLGDLTTSAACWRGLDERLPDHPLLDACLALQLASDGLADRAWPRLFHAARRFPGASSLALALADAALAMGDLPLAETWLAGLPAGTGPVALGRRRLLEADLLAARRQPDAAARAYRELAQADPTDPGPQLRLACLAAAQGDRDARARLLQSLRTRWPDYAPARLEAARDALLRRDLPAYLAEARYVLGQDLPQLPRAAASDLAAVLELGGLQDLLPPEAAADLLRARPPTHTVALPLAAWVRPAQLASLRRALEAVRVADGCLRAARTGTVLDVAAALRGAWHTALSLPGLTCTLPAAWQLTLLGAPPVLADAPARLLSLLSMPFARALDAPMRFVREQPLVQTTTDLQAFTFGLQTAFSRDFDGDSLPDVAIACPASRSTGGHVELRSLADGSLLRRLEAEGADHLFARSLAVLGDVDGDLCDDLLVGSPSMHEARAPRGEATLYSGRAGRVLWRTAGPTSTFGVAVARLADLDGDGVADFVVGAPPLSLTGGQRGRAFVGSGATGAILRELVPGQPGSWFGAALAAAGDVDGDGLEDVLVGGNVGNAPGLVVLFSGGTGAQLLTFADEFPGTDYGACVAGAGDADGDGTPDLAIGAPGLSSRGRDRGKVQILSGRSGQVIVELFGERPGEGFGATLAAAGEWVRGYRTSLAVAARRGGPVGTGYVRVFEAGSGQPQQTFAGGPTVVAFGHSLAAAGRLDDDPFPDMLVPCLLRDGTAMIWRMSFAQTKQPGR
ncbi:MAG: hypothetical protein FJ265_08165 [Planctomycetes bacterium]|nr:hypothetical protein [Planctomycetota bacterium]